MSREHGANLSNSNATSSGPLPNAVSLPPDKGPDIQVTAKRKRQVSRPLQLPRDRLALTFQRCREASGLSLYRLAERSGVDYAHLWRIEHGEHQDVSREILMLVSIALLLDTAAVDRIVEVADEILDAAGLKMLRAPWESSRPRPSGNTGSISHPEKRFE